MEGLLRSLRLLVGLVMIAAGSALVAPAALEAAAWWRAWQVVPAAGVEQEPAWIRGETQGGLQGGMPPAWQPAPGPATMLPPPAAASVPIGHVPPPPPPEPLPATPQAMAAAAPGMAPHYRSTVEAPPPPLLDGHAAPPLSVGWTTRQSPARPAAMADPEPGRIYVVRDGDDLTAIAIRFYAHPAAAAAIWHANRGVLRDPGVLPIGAALVLPPASVAMGGGDRAAVEPVVAADRGPAPTPPVSAASWLFGDSLSGPGRSPP